MADRGKLKTIVILLIIFISSLAIWIFYETTCRLRDSITEYTVVDKNHKEPYLITSITYVNRGLVPITKYYPEEWWIECQGIDSENNIQYFKFCTNEEKYNNTNIGDII